MKKTTIESRKVAIITGASSGIGQKTVLSFLASGYTVYACARRLDKMKSLEELGANICYLDLTCQSSIDDLITQVLAQESSIDVLVNNAGYGSYGAAEDVPMVEARRQFDVNLFGLAALTNAVLPTMRKQAAGRIIHVGSVGGKLWSILGSWYQATKYALEGYADCTRNELRPFGIDVILIQPGAIKTEWSSNVVENIEKTSGAGAYAPLAKAATTFFTNNKKMECDPIVVANAIIKAATVRKPKARYAAPRSAAFALFVRRFMSDSLSDKLFSRFMGIPNTIKQK